MSSAELYMFVLLGLVFFVTILTFSLLIKEKRRSERLVRRLNAAYIFALFLMVVFILLIMTEYQQVPSITLTNKDNYKITVSKEIESANLDEAGTYSPDIYIDGNETFFFTLPKSEIWSKPKVMNSFIAYIEQTGLEINKDNLLSWIKWNPYAQMIGCITPDFALNSYEKIKQCMDENLKKSEYGNMLKLGYSTQIEYGNPVSIRIKDRQHFFPEDSLSDHTHDSAGYTRLNFVNYFNITVLDKKRIPAADNRLTLASYFLHKTVNFASSLEKIIANENNIILTFSFSFKNSEIPSLQEPYRNFSEGSRSRDQIKEFAVHRWIRMIEENNMFYIIEITYSPQTDESSMIWSDLKNSFESVGILETKN